MATVETPPTPASPGAPAARRFSVNDYYQMTASGIIRPDERVELIAGQIYTMTPTGSPHASCVATLTPLLIRGVVDRAILWPQNPLRIDDTSEPQPDVMLLRPKADRYRSGLPGPADVLLLIEVMASSADMDRKIKLGVYTRAGVAEVWLVDLNEDQVEVYRRPADGQYRDVQIASRGQAVSPEAFADVVLSVDEILG